MAALMMVEEPVDLRGRPVNRNATGRWRACGFLVAFEACERMSFYSIASNLVVYLTSELHQGTVASSTNVSNWAASIWITPVVGAWIADAHLGRFWTFTVFSVVYIMGMCCLTLAVSLPSLKPPACLPHSPSCPHASSTQLGFFYFSLYLLCLGTGGTKANVSAFGADQFEDSDPSERLQKNSFFNWWYFSICFGTLFGTSALVYIQDNVGWGYGYGVPTLALILSVLIFLSGTPFYRHKRPSTVYPFSKIAQVFVAAAHKGHRSILVDESTLYELDPKQYESCGQTRLPHTSRFRFLDRAAVRKQTDDKQPSEGPWRLCTVTQVEETKLVLGMMPIWLGSLLFMSVLSLVSTFFVKQGTTLDTKIGRNFHIPPASLGAFVTLSMIILVPLYDRVLVPFVRRFTGIDRGITLLQRLGIGMFVQIFVMIIAAGVEIKRMKTAREYGLVDSAMPLPMSIFWLMPQYVLMGVAETFAGIALLEFFYDQAPNSMKSIGTAIYTTNIGVGWFLSSFLITVIHRSTDSHAGKSWLVNNLNRCRLDYFYWLLAVLLTINLGIFVLLARHYTYKSEKGCSETVQLAQTDHLVMDFSSPAA